MKTKNKKPKPKLKFKWSRDMVKCHSCGHYHPRDKPPRLIKISEMSPALRKELGL